jgi:hypothetical protein
MKHSSGSINDERREARFRLGTLSREHLLSLTGRTLKQCSIPATQTLTATWMFCLEFDQEEVLQLSTDSVDVADWDELGCLVIAATTVEVVRSQLALPRQTWVLDNFIVAECIALVYENVAWRIESGIALRSTNEKEIIVVPGVPPGSVSVRLEGSQTTFVPELPMHEYKYQSIGANAA